MFLPSNITLKFGDSGDFVSELQRRLAAVDAYPKGQINGFFDGLTVNGVSTFQARCSLRADGIAGPETLRRLNATLTGGTTGESSGGGGAQEEEQTAVDLARTFYMIDHQPGLTPAPMEPQHPQQETGGMGEPVQHAGHHQGMGGMQFGTAAPMESQLTEQQQIQQQLMREAQMHQQHFAQNHDQIAQTLLQQSQRQGMQSPDAQAQLTAQQQQQGSPDAQAQLTAQQQLAAQQQHPQQQGAPVRTEPQPSQPLNAQQLQQQQLQQQQQQQQAQLQQQPVGQQQAPAAGATTTQAEPAKGLVGRAMEKVDALVQKLTAYFEAKLSPDVLHEVKNIGQVMMQSGVREVAIPGGADQVRSQPTPARAPEPMQIPQRG